MSVAAAEFDLFKLASTIDDEASRQTLLMLCDLISDAQHFKIPDNGRIFNDRLKGLKGEILHLPFPTITLSFKNTVVIAFEDGVDKIIVVGIYEIDGRWFPCPYSVTIDINWDNIDATCELYEDLSNSDNKFVVRAGMKPIFPYIIGKTTEDRSKDHRRIASHYSINVLEFCEAFSCSNVEVAVLTPAPKESVNEKRMRKNKLPIYEMKVLTVKVPNVNKEHIDSGRTHASPRQHLRRGHIRMLNEKKIWVNSCVVGKYGKIDKTYKVVFK